MEFLHAEPNTGFPENTTRRSTTDTESDRWELDHSGPRAVRVHQSRAMPCGRAGSDGRFIPQSAKLDEMPDRSPCGGGDHGLKDLLAATALGQHEAFAELHRRTWGRLLWIAVRLLGDRGRAEEVTQEAFLSIWLHAGDYAPERSLPMTWMSSIVRNRSLSVRRVRADLLGAERITQESDSDEASNFEPFSVSRESGSAFWPRFETMKGCYRQALALAYVEDLSHSEVAVRLGVPLGTVKTWIRRGLEALRVACARDLDDVTPSNAPSFAAPRRTSQRATAEKHIHETAQSRAPSGRQTGDGKTHPKETRDK